VRAVVVVGGGAMGSWLAVQLSRSAAVPVVLLARRERAEALSSHGLVLERLAGVGPDDHPRKSEPGPGLQIETQPDKLPKEALVFFAVRAYQTQEAAKGLCEAGVRPWGVVTLQNGLGNADTLTEVFGAQKVAAGATSHGVWFRPPARFVHAGWGRTWLGPWVPQAAEIASQAAGLLEAAGIPVERVDDPRKVLWQKVAVNAAINPPTAIHGVPNGALLEDAAWERDLREAAREAARVAVAEGVGLDEEEAERSAVEVARATARNRSSMLQAREAGKRLEADAITGQIVSRARRHGIEVPVNQRHWKELQKLMERGSGNDR
jgi:2-dehydropantoate 2-reductase